MANAVLDGVDGILLGAETLRGRHPVSTVDTILHICKQAEKVFDHHHHFDRLMQVRSHRGLHRQILPDVQLSPCLAHPVCMQTVQWL